MKEEEEEGKEEKEEETEMARAIVPASIRREKRLRTEKMPLTLIIQKSLPFFETVTVEEIKSTAQKIHLLFHQ